MTCASPEYFSRHMASVYIIAENNADKYEIHSKLVVSIWLHCRGGKPCTRKKKKRDVAVREIDVLRFEGWQGQK